MEGIKHQTRRGSFSLKKNKKERKKKRESAEGTGRMPPPCYETLEAWRDCARDWLCRIYAFAVPNNAAIKVMAEHQPLVEIGCGTGYWVSVLRKAGIDIIGYDSHPGFQNDYHGDARAHAKIEFGKADILSNSKLAPRALFLCYPPPDSEMALHCLQNFRGKTLIHVGEYAGDTGTLAFQMALQSDFALKQAVSLPNFGNTCYSLTVWERKPHAGKLIALSPCSLCAACGSRQGLASVSLLSLCEGDILLACMCYGPRCTTC